jgi:hypothetical protein
MKYVMFGGAATALMLFGISHLYGLTGHFDFAGIGRELVGMPLAAMAALLLAATGAAYKLTIVPFHFYSPDVYQGAPPLGIAAATAAPKLAVGAVLLRAFAAMPPSPVGPGDAAGRRRRRPGRRREREPAGRRPAGARAARRQTHRRVQRHRPRRHGAAGAGRRAGPARRRGPCCTTCSPTRPPTSARWCASPRSNGGTAAVN